MTDLSHAQWRKATRSGTANGGCVEIASNLPGVAIRDSKRPEDGARVVDRARSPRSWRTSRPAGTTSEAFLQAAPRPEASATRRCLDLASAGKHGLGVQ